MGVSRLSLPGNYEFASGCGRCRCKCKALLVSLHRYIPSRTLTLEMELRDDTIPLHKLASEESLAFRRMDLFEFEIALTGAGID